MKDKTGCINVSSRKLFSELLNSCLNIRKILYPSDIKTFSSGGKELLMKNSSNENATPCSVTEFVTFFIVSGTETMWGLYSTK